MNCRNLVSALKIRAVLLRHDFPNLVPALLALLAVERGKNQTLITLICAAARDFGLRFTTISTSRPSAFRGDL